MSLIKNSLKTAYYDRLNVRAYAILHNGPIGSHPQTPRPGPSTSKFPFPSSPNPSPHQIFHLKEGATSQEIKQRYFDLVKIHHPDSNSPCSAHLPATTRHERFQSITAAYNYLLKKPGSHSTSWPPKGSPSAAVWENARRRQAESPRGRVWTGRRNQWGGFEYQYDDNEDPLRGKAQSHPPGATEKIYNPEDKIFWIMGSLAVGGAIFHFFFFSPTVEAAKSHATALQYLEDARKGRQEYGHVRRREVKKWVESQPDAEEEQRSGVLGLGRSTTIDKYRELPPKKD